MRITRSPPSEARDIGRCLEARMRWRTFVASLGDECFTGSDPLKAAKLNPANVSNDDNPHFSLWRVRAERGLGGVAQRGHPNQAAFATLPGAGDAAGKALGVGD